MATIPARCPTANLFAAGDVRANENTELTSLHDPVRAQPQRLATELASKIPSVRLHDWTDEQPYQEARKLNIAEYQNIIYTQYLPALLGPDAPAYTGYNPNVNATIATEFSTVAFRFGHSMLNNTVARDANNGSSVGAVPLAEDFFDPNLVNPNGAIDPTTGLAATDIGAYLKGDADNTAQAVDSPGGLRGPRRPVRHRPRPGGEDLISRDIWRARDDGIGTYNQVRVAFGLPAITDTSPRPTVTGHLSASSRSPATSTVQHELETAYATTSSPLAALPATSTPSSAAWPRTTCPAPTWARCSRRSSPTSSRGSRTATSSSTSTSRSTRQEQAILQQGGTLAQIITTNTGVTNLQLNVFKYTPSVIGVVLTNDPGHLPQGVAGVTVELIDSKGNVTTTVTDANGYYSFGQQPAGNYTVSIVTPSGDMQVPLSPTTVNVTLAARMCPICPR